MTSIKCKRVCGGADGVASSGRSRLGVVSASSVERVGV